MSAIHELALVLNRELNRIALLFPKEYKLTLVARHLEDDAAHIILTADDPVAAAGALRAMAEHPR